MAISMTIAVLGGFVSLLLLFLWRSLLLLFLWRNFLLSPSLRLPPGPRPLPIVGNLLMMRKYGSLEGLANAMKHKYGPIVTLWMGSKPWVIISGPALLQEAMITQGNVFMGRNRFPSLRIQQNGYNTLFSDHGERHRFLRKVLVSGVLSNKRVADCRPIREREVEILVESLKKQQLDGDHDNARIVTNFRSLIRLTITNLLMGILFGRRLTQEEHMTLDEVMLLRFEAISGRLSDFMPWLAWIPGKKGTKHQEEVQEKTFQAMEPLIEERKRLLKSANTDQATFVDTLLGLQRGELQSPIEISDKDVVLTCMETLNAGTDSTALNLEYCIANLINHPEIQEKLAHEISALVGERVVEEDDIPRLPYLHVVVTEALRRHTPARVGLPRRALSATKVAGYDIPANTIVLQHIESVSLSPQIWEDPLEFRPERHLNKTLDITGSTEMTMIPFGVGRRICPAIHIASIHEQFILARLVQAFEWKSVIPGQLLDVSASAGISAPMKYPLVASLQERWTGC